MCLSILYYVGLGFRKAGSAKLLLFPHVSFIIEPWQPCKCVPVWMAEKGLCGKGRNAFLCQFSGSSSSWAQAASIHFRDIPSVSLAVVFPSRPCGTPSDSLEPLGPLEAWDHMPDPTKQGCRALSVLIEGHMQQWKVARQMWVQM